MIFIDTNYFLRLLDDDKSDLHKKATDFFLRASSGKGAYMTSTLVIFEVYWVLKSFYHQDKMHLVSMIGSILKMDFIELTDRLILLKALSRFSGSSFELEDCYHLEFAKTSGCRGVATFDTKLIHAFED
jgi:predicted nucleic acid-binding protein